MTRLTRTDRNAIRQVLAANGLAPCTHPDCDPRKPSCATNSIFLRAQSAAVKAFQLGTAIKKRTRP